MLRAVIFDLDGTLVDSTYLHTVAWWQALRSHGHDVPMATVHRAIGVGGDRILDVLLPVRDRSRDDELRAAHADRMEPWLGRLRALDGAPELLRACRGLGVRVAGASSAGERDLGVMLDLLGGPGVLDVVVGADDVAASKPSPDLLEAALDRLGVPPPEAVMVGDTVWDAQAARRAGVRFVGVTTGGTSAAELLDAGALAVHSGPRDLLQHLRTSPRRVPAGA